MKRLRGSATAAGWLGRRRPYGAQAGDQESKRPYMLASSHFLFNCRAYSLVLSLGLRVIRVHCKPDPVEYHFTATNAAEESEYSSCRL